MKKNIVVYYSRTGSNRFLAEKISKKLNCDIYEIKPRLNMFFFLMIFSMIKRSFGIKKSKYNFAEYDNIILSGPIWMGKLISPLRDFMNKYFKSINRLYFVTCCGSSDKDKEKQFGHALVFKLVKENLGDKCVHCEAFPIGLLLPEDEKENSDLIMKTRLSEVNFNEEMKDRFEKFINKINE